MIDMRGKKRKGEIQNANGGIIKINFVIINEMVVSRL